MAAPKRKTEVGSSSSDDEALKRCREAVWETQANKRKDGDSGMNKSKRVVATNHEHDGNELQVTRGFQTHVAKKLEHFLDSCISEMQPETSHGLESTNCDRDNQEEGFRLFSTSLLGQKDDHPPAPVRHRPAPSSSDSDSEVESRLKEAAVSIKDLLPSSTLPSIPRHSSTETPGSEKTQKKNEVEEESRIIRKKKKQNDEEREQVDSAGSAPDQSNGERRSSEQEHVKVKRKKKKKQKENSEEETLS